MKPEYLTSKIYIWDNKMVSTWCVYSGLLFTRSPCDITDVMELKLPDSDMSRISYIVALLLSKTILLQNHE